MNWHTQFIRSVFFVLLLLSASGLLFAQGNGSIWTTTGSCGDDTQDTNHFLAGEQVWINGSNFDPGTYPWSIEGKPGGASCDPRIVVASGSIIVDASRAFCFLAYTVAGDDCGEYSVSVGGKNDNYRVDATAILDITGILVTPSWPETITWAINKQASPTHLDLFNGDMAQVLYRVQADKTVVTSPAVISGSVALQNTGSAAPEGFSLTIILKREGATIDQVNITTWAASGSYPFSFTLAAPAAGPYVVEATAVVTNGSGDTYSQPAGLSKQITGYPEIHVSDRELNWIFPDDGQVTYTRTLNCANAGVFNNTATITETGQSASAAVSVACYDLVVTKTALTTFDRRYSWQIRKNADKSEVNVPIQLPFDPAAPLLLTPVNYAVSVATTGYTDLNWQASGTITVTNPAPVPAVLKNILDVLPGASPTFDFGVTFPYTLAPGAVLQGTWSAALPDGASRINTATAVRTAFSFPLNAPAVDIGESRHAAQAAVSFAAPTREIDECVQVTDDRAGTLGTVCAAAAPQEFTYMQNFGPWTPQDCGQSVERNNTASLTTNDTGSILNASWMVRFNVSCQAPQRSPLGVRACCIDPFVYKPTMRVHFEVTNPNTAAVEIPHGLNNALDPAAYQGTQPTLFAPGVTVWEVEIGRNEVLQWLLDGSVATASLKLDVCAYAAQDDVYIAGVGVFYDTNHNGRFDAGETLLAPDFSGQIGEVYLVDQGGKTLDSRVLNSELFFRAGRQVNFAMRQIWGEHYLVPQLSVPLPAGYRIYPNYRVVHTNEFPEPFYSLENDFGLVPAGFVPDPLTNLDQPWIAALDWYLAHPVKPGVAKAASEQVQLAAVPAAFALEQNYPNPFNPQTTIRYDLPEQTQVSLTVYDVSGAAVARLTEGEQAAGSYTRVWNAAGNPSGIYFYELKTAGFRQIRRMLLLK